MALPSTRYVALLSVLACAKETTEIPDLEPPPVTDDELERDEAIGLLRSRSRLLVMLDGEAAPSVAGAALAAAGEGTTILGGFPELGLMLLKVSDGTDLDQARQAVSEVDGVTVAEADYVMSPDTLFKLPDPLAGPLLDTDGQAVDWTWGNLPGGSNWWLEHVHMPSAWNWNDAIERAGGDRVAVGVVDTGVMADHVRLAGRVERLDAEPTDAHGTGVAGVISARFDDQLHVNGATPWAAVTAVSMAGEANSIATIGDVVMTWTRQLLRHSDVRVLNLSAGYNWFENQNPTRDASGAVLQAPVPVADRTDQQHVVRQQAEIAARHADWLARQDPPVLLVVSAGNDGLDPADISPTIAAGDRPHAEAWTAPDARWNSPYCNAAVERVLENVYCVEANQVVTNWSVSRTTFSSVGGTLSAPGERMGLLQDCTGVGCSSGADGYAHGSGTSFSSPLVAGILAHMLAFAPHTSAQALRAAVMGNLRPSTGSGAGGIDAFAAMLALDGAEAALLDVDDGTPQGLDVTVEADARGDGDVDMADFRRVRDALLWDQGLRDHLASGVGDAKRDHNRDGRLSDADPEVLSRFDFNGDAELNTDDLIALGGDAWEDDDVPGAVLGALEHSADLQIDATDLLLAGVTEIELTAVGTPYAFRMATGPATPLFTVVAGTVQITGTVITGSLAVGIKPVTVTVGAGEDAVLELERDLPTAPGWVEVPVRIAPAGSCGAEDDAAGWVFGYLWMYACPDLGTPRLRMVAEVPAWSFPGECGPSGTCTFPQEKAAQTIEEVPGFKFLEEEAWAQEQYAPPAQEGTHWLNYSTVGFTCIGPLALAEHARRQQATTVTCYGVP